ncbi:MAG: VOC family protein [Bacteroidota bacterium]
MNLDHIALWVIDLEREKEFFLRYFDCTAGEKYCNPSKGFTSYFIAFPGGGRIEIMKREGMEPAGRGESAGYAHIAVSAGTREEVDRLTHKLRSEGVPVESGPRITGDGYYESVILDPENNVIEIVSA